MRYRTLSLRPESLTPWGCRGGAASRVIGTFCVWAAVLPAGPLHGQDPDAHPRVEAFMDFRADDAATLFERALSEAGQSWVRFPVVAETGECPGSVRAGSCWLMASSDEDLELQRYTAVVATAGWVPTLPLRDSLAALRCRHEGQVACASRGAVPYLGFAPIADGSASYEAWRERVGERLSCEDRSCWSIFERAPHPEQPEERALLLCETGTGEVSLPPLPRSCSLVGIESPQGVSWLLTVVGWGSPAIAARAGLGEPVAAGLVADAWNATVIRPDSLDRADLLQAVAAALADAPLELPFVDFWLPLDPLVVEGRVGLRSSPVLGAPTRWEEVEIQVLAVDDPGPPRATVLRARLNLWVSPQNHRSGLRFASEAHLQQYTAVLVDRIRAALAEACGVEWAVGNVLDCAVDPGRDPDRDPDRSPDPEEDEETEEQR